MSYKFPLEKQQEEKERARLAAQLRSVLKSWVIHQWVEFPVGGKYVFMAEIYAAQSFLLWSQDTARAPVMVYSCPLHYLSYGPGARCHFSMLPAPGRWSWWSFPTPPVGISHSVFWKTCTLNGSVCGLIITPTAGVCVLKANANASFPLPLLFSFLKYAVLTTGKPLWQP